MRPVRFVALSEDGQALVLADEVGRLLTLPIDDRVSSLHAHRPGAAARDDRSPATSLPRSHRATSRPASAPASRAEDVARIAGVPVDRVLRYAGPVLQERAMLAQHARRTRLKTSDKGASLADVVDARLSQHGVDMEKISWDAYRRDDGTWRVVATWPSGKANATAVWELDKARQLVAPARRHGALPVRHRRSEPGLPPRARGRRAPARPRRARADARAARAGAGPAATRSAPAATRCSPRWSVHSGHRPSRSLDPMAPAARCPGRVGRRHRRGAAPARRARLLRGRRDSADGDPGRAVAGRAAPPAHRARPGHRPATGRSSAARAGTTCSSARAPRRRTPDAPTPSG